MSLAARPGKRAVFAGAFAIAYLVAWWLVEGEASPLHGFFLYHAGVGNLLTWLSLPAVLAGFAISGNVHQPSGVGTLVGMFVQWFVVGWLLSFAIPWFRKR